VQKTRPERFFFFWQVSILPAKANSMKTLRLHHLVAVLSILLVFVSCDTGQKENPPAEPIPVVAPTATATVSTKTKTKSSAVHQPVQKSAALVAETQPELAVEISGPVSLDERLEDAKAFAEENGYATDYCFLVDFSIKSGKNRFFVYDLETNERLLSGLVAHGSCFTQFLSQAKFSNSTDCGCSSSGRYKVGGSYKGQWGKSFRLYGLDKSNSNAFKRAIVIHAHDEVPDEEIYPRVLVNSYGCPMVSHSFFKELSQIIEGSDKPILLWIYN